MNGRQFGRSLWVAVLLLLASAMAWGQNSTGPKRGINSLTNEFNDVKSPPLQESDIWGTTWMIHIEAPNLPGGTGAITNYAGFLFDLQYDGHEVSELGVLPSGPHVALELPGAGGLTDFALFLGSNSTVQRVEPVAAWIDPGLAIQSGMTLPNSLVTTLVHVTFHAKNTTTAYNSDTDIHISQLGVIRHVPFGQTSQIVSLPASAWVYATPDNDPALSQINWASGPGGGVWKHIAVDKNVHIFGSAFWATPIFNGHAASYGIEHVPEPATIGLLAAGMVAIGIGRMRRRVGT